MINLNQAKETTTLSQKTLVASIFYALLYVCGSVFANILSTKISYLPILNLEFDAGTIIYPLVFIARDILHKMLGKFVANAVVLLNGFFVMLMAILFYTGSILPISPNWPNQDAYNLILTPVTRIIIASIIAEIVANLLNSSIFSAIVKKNYSLDIIASLVSNGVAVLIDSIVFSLIAFYGIMPTSVVLEIILANFAVKASVAVLFSPAIKLIKYNRNKDLL